MEEDFGYFLVCHGQIRVHSILIGHERTVCDGSQLQESGNFSPPATMLFDRKGLAAERLIIREARGRDSGRDA